MLFYAMLCYAMPCFAMQWCGGQRVELEHRQREREKTDSASETIFLLCERSEDLLRGDDCKEFCEELWTDPLGGIVK